MVAALEPPLPVQPPAIQHLNLKTCFPVSPHHQTRDYCNDGPGKSHEWQKPEVSCLQSEPACIVGADVGNEFHMRASC